MSSKILRQERELVNERTEALVMDHLGEVEEGVLTLLNQRREEIVGALNGLDLGPENLRSLERSDSRLGQIVRLEATSGDLIHPPMLGHMTVKEETFLERTRGLWDRSPGLTSSEDGEDRQGAWQPLFWQEGLYLIYWWPAADGTVVGVELDRVRFLADVIGVLPASGPSEDVRGLSLRLRRAGGTALYSWGPTAMEGSRPVAQRALAEPLSSWSLEAFSVSPTSGDSLEKASTIQFIAILMAALLAMVGSAAYLWWESRRRIREADQRVTFVNQVAHELKTPLTNIRLYAELLADRLPQSQRESPGSSAAREPGHYAAVVVGEAQRLSRLIHNVLDFGRSRRGALSIHRQPGHLNEKLREIVDRFRPAHESCGFEVLFKTADGAATALGGGSLRHVVGNLLRCTERYAAA
ncbi:MAG: HAMP domain-containing histidine kinase, partial [bacterium]|nr:HAMP domain-containing histidine kinase [bacterium]